MTCNATRIQLSNTDATTVEFTVSSTPADGTVVAFTVAGLSISASPTTTAGVASVAIPSVAGGTNDIYDATLQVGSNAAIAVDVLVVETNEDQAIGVTISDAGVTYCAPTSGGGGGGTSPVYEYIYGNAEQLAELKSDDVHLSIFGDSLSSNAGTEFTTLFHAAFFEFHPDRWTGAWFHTNGTDAGVKTGRPPGESDTSVPAGSDLMVPGTLDRHTSNWSRSGIASANTTQDWDAQFYLQWLSSTQATRKTNEENPGDHVFGRWPDGARIFVNADGERTIAASGNIIQMRSQMIGYDTADFCLANLECRLFDPNTVSPTGWGSTPMTGGTGYWTEVISSTNVSTGFTGDESTGYWTFQIRDQTDAKRQILESVFFGDTSAGFQLSYFGDGGWRFRNHYPPGETIATTQGTSAYHYEPEAMAGRMAALGTTHAMVILGANDIKGSGRTGEEVLADFDLMLGKLRTASPGIKIVALTVFEASGWSESMNTARGVFNAGLKSRAETVADLTVLDMAGFIEDEFDTAAAFSSAWLDDGTHFNQAGASAVSSWIWGRVVASTGGVTSVQGRTGEVVLTAADFDPVVDAYNILIESPVNKSSPGYMIDQRVVTSRTIKNLYAKTASGTCTVVVKRSGTATVATLAVTSAVGSVSADSTVAPGNYLEIEVSNASSPVDLAIVVEYEQ